MNQRKPCRWAPKAGDIVHDHRCPWCWHAATLHIGVTECPVCQLLIIIETYGTPSNTDVIESAAKKKKKYTTKAALDGKRLPNRSGNHGETQHNDN